MTGARHVLALALVAALGGADAARKEIAAPAQTGTPAPARTSTNAAAAMPAGMPAMAEYRFGLLSRGPNWTPGRTPATDSVQAGHMANIHRMADQGVLLAAGPFLDGGDLRGVFIFGADTTRLRSLVNDDPAIRAGRLKMDLYSWWAPAGIGEPYKEMAKQPGFRDSMVRMPLVLLKRGPKWTAQPGADAARLQAAHVRGIFAGLASGVLATAGPFTNGDDRRGVLVFRGDSASAHRWAMADSAVQAGLLTVEMLRWYAAYGTMPGDTLSR